MVTRIHKNIRGISFNTIEISLVRVWIPGFRMHYLSTAVLEEASQDFATPYLNRYTDLTISLVKYLPCTDSVNLQVRFRITGFLDFFHRPVF
jgi:hypothetical protein